MLGRVLTWRHSFGTDTLPFLPPPADFLRGFSQEELGRQYTRKFRDPEGGLEQVLRTIRRSYVASWHKWVCPYVMTTLPFSLSLSLCGCDCWWVGVLVLVEPLSQMSYRYSTPHFVSSFLPRQVTPTPLRKKQ